MLLRLMSLPSLMQPNNLDMSLPDVMKMTIVL